MAKSKKPAVKKPDTNAGLRTLAEIVQLTGVSAGQIGEAAKRGFIASSGRGRYQLGLTLVGLLKFKNSRESQLPTYDNAAQCSAATGIPMTVIKEARRKTQLGHGGSIGLGPLLKVIFESSGENPIETRSKYAALSEKMDYEIKAGHWLYRPDVAHTVKRGLAGLFRLMDQRSNVDLPPVLEGLAAADMSRELVKSDDDLKRNITQEWEPLMRNGEAKK